MKSSLLSFLIVLSVLVAFTSCRKDELVSDDSSIVLTFSRDTVLFDTVFTTVGSATRTLKVYNNSSNAIEISDIYLGGDENSAFRVNVDGDPGTDFEDVMIPGGDSIFIFVEVTVDPNGANTPLIEEDSLVFITNGNVQDVDLVAWGQDANFFFPTNQVSGLPDFTCLDGDCLNDGGPVDVTWTSEKPYVIYGYLIVDSLDHLTIEAGTTVYFHNGSGLWVFEDGQITVNGTVEAPVTFRHDRLESLYDDLPGQWDLIRVNEGQAGRDNIFRNVVIKNSILGIQAQPLVLQEEDVFKPVSENQLILENVIIQQTSAFGLFLRNYRVDAKNSVFASSGQYSCGITGGGSYDFQHCTFGNYWLFGTRTTPGFFMSNLYEDEAGFLQSRDISFFNAQNSIFYGNTFEEFLVEFDENQTLDNIGFSHCLVRIDEMDISDDLVYQDMFSNVSAGPGFEAPSEHDFSPRENAFIIDKGDPALILGNDILGNPRDGLPDLGAYERVD